MYCRAMLLLFKPWQFLESLKSEDDSWSEAFEKKSFLPKLIRIIKNMNVENECKDARDAHAILVREQKRKPHMYSHEGSGDAQIDADAFDKALFADTSLDSTEN
jgi:hypothetical protein